MKKKVDMKTKNDVTFLEFVCPKCKTPYGFIGFKLKKVKR
jgi:phage FluMu protein Com